jgi:hypothetical protein
VKPPELAVCTEEELWKFVAWHLAKNGIDTVLVGGAVAAIFSKGIYRSGDLDFINLTFPRNLDPGPALKEIGFVRHDSRHFIHPECMHLSIEFVSPPLSIGEDYSIVPMDVEVEDVTIKIITPTDSIKDRLASYIYFHARECLDQAILVAQNQNFSLGSIKKWCKKEGAAGISAFKDFERLISAKQS